MVNKLILAVDPGKRNGIALFRDELDGELVVNMVMSVDELITWLNTVENGLSAIVYEDFIIAPGKNHGSKGEAMQTIGILKMAANRLRIPITKQRPENRLTGAKWAGEKVPKGHMPDIQSARLHGIFYMRRQGKFTTVLEREKHVSKSG